MVTLGLIATPPVAVPGQSVAVTLGRSRAQQPP
jgi:hypothetical protein